jgi:amino acid transporter
MRDGALSDLRRRSPVHGLDRRNLGPLGVLAQSVSTTAPAAAMATVPAIVAATAGPGTLWSFAVATVLALLIGSCIGQFTRRMAAAGSLYSLTAKGLGPVSAFSSGVALLVGYGVLAMAALSGAATYLDALVAGLGGSAPGSRWVLAGAVCALALLATASVLARVRLSARVVLLVEVLSISALLAVFTVLLTARTGPVGSVAVGPDHGLAGIAAGVLPAFGAIIGFEAATALGVEARRPFRSIPRAVQGTAAGAGVLYLFAAYTQVAGYAGAGGGLAGRPQPVLGLVTARSQVWLSVLLDLGIAMSFFACVLAASNALVRVLFSMARDGIAPAALGATHRHFRTPYVAIAVALPVVAAVPAALLGAGVPGQRALADLIVVSVVGYLVAYLLVCLAAPLFLRRIGELTPGPVVVTAVLVPVLVVVLGASVASAWGGALPIVIAALTGAGLGWLGWLRVRRPDRLARIGVYDETLAADVLQGPVR